MRAPALIDATLTDRVLVYGSLPPAGRDLDLLVRTPEEQAVGACLLQAGFVCRGNEWARFASCAAEVVELAHATSWNLPADQLDALFGEALGIDGLRLVVRPAPHHDLLILARRIAWNDGVLDIKRRARIEQALSEDPNAWDHARALADRWSARLAVGALEDAWRTDTDVPAARCEEARQERSTSRGGPSHRMTRLMAKASRLPRPHRGAVVAFSGLDGAGKSSQAAALRDTLESLGYEAVVVRTRIAWDDSLWTIAGPIRQLLTPPLRALARLRSVRRAEHRSAAPEGPATAPVDGHEQHGVSGPAASPEPLHPVTRVREASALLTDLWTLMITLANAASQWKLMRRQLLRGGIVICDRYTLDSIVELRYSYGRERSFHTARAALSVLYPTPVRAYFLDVPPNAAFERKGEWGIQWLTEHRDLYLEECSKLGVNLLDGELPEAELCATIARDVWLSEI